MDTILSRYLKMHYDHLMKEAIALLHKIAECGHADAQYFLRNCYANGTGTPKGVPDYTQVHFQFGLAAKHGHPEAAYLTGKAMRKGGVAVVVHRRPCSCTAKLPPNRIRVPYTDYVRPE